MSELLEIIIEAIDNASEVFEGVGEAARDAEEAIQDNFNGSEFEGMTSALEEANAEVERLTEELAGIYMGDIEGDADAVESALAAAQEEAARLRDEIENTKDQTSETNGEMEGLAGVLQGIAGAAVFEQLSSALLDMADKAGTVQDSWTRMGLAAEGAGIDVGTMKGAVSELSTETGRAGGQIRESFIAMTSAGITDMGTMQQLFKGASAQAFILGTDVDSLANKFSGMAMKSSIAERTLKGTGITIDELGSVLGMQGASIDEINAKWETMDVNARAAALGQAAAMNEGEEANDAYKSSWEGLQAQIDIAKGKLEVLVGKVVLPVLIPALQVAGRVLSWLGDTIGAVMDGPLGGFISVVGSVAAAIMLAIPAYMAYTAAMGLLKNTVVPAALEAASALWAMVAPLLPFIAIGAAIAIIIYEIGKAFGWWTDVGSMLDAIGAGLQRLWNAFINHPDVQAAIQIISGALQTLWSWIQQAGQAVLEFFGITESGNFDIVATVIQTIGGLWEAFKGTLLSVIGVVTSVYNTINWVFTTIWSIVGPIVMQLIGLVQGLIGAFNNFKNGQLSLPQLVMTVLTLLWNTYKNIFTYIGNLVLKFGRMLLARGLSAARGFVMAIVNWVRQLPSRVYSLLIQVVSRIRSGIQAWITAASTKVSSLITAITSPFSGVAGAISGALSGVVSAIKAPFQAAWNAVKPLIDKIEDGMKLIGARGGETAAGGETATDTSTGGVFNIATGQYLGTDNKVVIEDNINLTLDLKNVPSNISTAQLIEALNNKEVLNALVNNRDFQSIDAQVKQRISLKNSRSGR